MTKVNVISGFLGAGKTTLIKKLLDESFKGEKIVLIENEFGEIGIDGGFLKDAGVEITEMNSGCICCSLVGDFGAALKQVLADYAAAQAQKEAEAAELARERKLQEAMLGIKNKYGKNAILKGTNLIDGATAADRNGRIGGHKA